MVLLNEFPAADPVNKHKRGGRGHCRYSKAGMEPSPAQDLTAHD